MWVRETPRASFLTAMEHEMKRIKSAIAEANTQERLVKKELAVMKQLYRGELGQIDSMWLEVCQGGRAPAGDARAPLPRHTLRGPASCRVEAHYTLGDWKT